jgi:hypothetical protein
MALQRLVWQAQRYFIVFRHRNIRFIRVAHFMP